MREGDSGLIIPGQPMRIPMRFAKSQARVLEAIVEKLEQRSLPGADVSFFKQCAETARRGEPLMIECESIDEVHAMADAFPAYGVVRPIVGS